MVAAVLTLLWRDVPGVTELGRLLETEGFLWCHPTKVSQQALSQRFLTIRCHFIRENLSSNLAQAESQMVASSQSTITRKCAIYLIEV